MTERERIDIFLDSFYEGNHGFLAGLEEKAMAEGVPLIRPGTQVFLKTLISAVKPLHVLEIGTAVGFSALLMCEAGPREIHVATIEQDSLRAAQARENIRSAGRASQVTILEGEAGGILRQMNDCREEDPLYHLRPGEGFDLIFMDAAKGQYIHWLPDVLKLMHSGSILVSDNCLQEMELLESHYAVRRRDRTIYRRMREYLFALTHEKRLQTSILPVGDGIALSVML